MKKINKKGGRPATKSTFRKSLVKSANERLRKIEKVYGLTEDSNEYRIVQKYAMEYPKTKGRIYKFVDDNGKTVKDPTKATGIRFLNQTEYNALTPKEKRYYNESLDKFLNASTSTKTGIDVKYQKAYSTFMQNYGDRYSSMTPDMYRDFFRTYRDMVSRDRKNQFDYNTLVQTLEYIDIGIAMNENQIKQVMRYVATDKWSKIPRRYRQSNR